MKWLIDIEDYTERLDELYLLILITLDSEKGYFNVI